MTPFNLKNLTTGNPIPIPVYAHPFQHDPSVPVTQAASAMPTDGAPSAALADRISKMTVPPHSWEEGMELLKSKYSKIITKDTSDREIKRFSEMECPEPIKIKGDSSINDCTIAYHLRCLRNNLAETFAIEGLREVMANPELGTRERFVELWGAAMTAQLRRTPGDFDEDGIWDEFAAGERAEINAADSEREYADRYFNPDSPVIKADTTDEEIRAIALEVARYFLDKCRVVFDVPGIEKGLLWIRQDRREEME